MTNTKHFGDAPAFPPTLNIFIIDDNECIFIIKIKFTSKI